MSYAVGMNGDNPDTRIIGKIRGFLQISFLELEHALPCFKLSMKGNLSLKSRTIATEIQAHVKISQFITLLVKRSDSFRYTEKKSMRTI